MNTPNETDAGRAADAATPLIDGGIMDVRVAEASLTQDAHTAWTLAFQPPQTIAIGPTDFYAIDCADVTGDGRSDVVVVATRLTNPQQSGLLVYPQSQNGNLLPPNWYQFDSKAKVLGAGLATGDVTGDGRIDVVLTTTSGIGVMAQDDAGALLAAAYSPVADAGFDILGDRVGLGTFGADKRLDAVQSGGPAHSIQLWMRADAGFEYAGGFLPPYLEVLAVGDVTGDGKQDVVATHTAVGNLTVTPGVGPAQLGAPSTYTFESGVYTGWNQNLAVGDVTGDGLVDAVVAYGGNVPNAHVVVMPQKGAALTTPLVYPSLDSPGTVRLADMNGDGLLDAVVAHWGWGRVGIYLQTPNGAFDAERYFAFNSGPVTRGAEIGVCDLNGDGHPDVVGVPYASNAIMLLLSQ